jgi:hypothetical protein
MACASDGEKDEGGESSLPSSLPGTATGTVTTPQGTFDVVDGVAFPDLWGDGNLAVALFTWENPGCDDDEWMWDALDQPGEYAWIEAYHDGESGPDVTLTWGDGQDSGTGGMLGDGELVLEPAGLDGLQVGDTVSGSIDYTEDAEGAVSATFEVSFCGELGG